MAEDSAQLSNQYRVDPLYLRMTLPRATNDDRSAFPSVQDLFGSLSQTSQFKVSLYLSNGDQTVTRTEGVTQHLASCGLLNGLDNLRYDFLCHSVTLPGTNLGITEETGSRQGVTEKFATIRQYPDLTLEFYVDAQYNVIRLFEEWMHYINPLYDGDTGREFPADPQGSVAASNALSPVQYYRLRYPEQYKRNIAVTKFERNFVLGEGREEFQERPNMITYNFLNAFPTQLTALPVSYEGSTITKTSITFTYDRYILAKHNADSGRGVVNDQISQLQQTLSFNNNIG